MLQQQEQLRALQGRQAALLALQHKAEQAIAVMDDSGMPQSQNVMLINRVQQIIVLRSGCQLL